MRTIQELLGLPAQQTCYAQLSGAGDGASRPLMVRLRELEAKRNELAERIAYAPVDIPDIHPNVAGIYRRKVERLAEALRHPQERDEAAEAIRALIERITVTPGLKRGQIDATLHGDLNKILEWATRTGQKNKTDTPDAGVSVSVVAGTRNRRLLQLIEQRISRIAA